MEPDSIRAQLNRMLASSAFAGADRSSRFLRFVVERALDGRHEEIKESIIGVEVLGRSPSFNPKTDPIVRVEAGRLRMRLTSYYESEGKSDSILIALPKGGYSPEFAAQAPPASANRVAKVSLSRSFLLVTAGAVLGLVVAILGLDQLRTPPPAHNQKVTILPPPGVDILSSAISPDGRRIAFSGVSGTRQMLWVRDLDSLDAKPLNGTDDAAYPFWSPDGGSVGFFSVDKVKRIDLLGGSPQDVTEARIPRGAAWGSRDIVFAPRPRGGLVQVAASGGTPRPATELDPARGEVAHSFPYFLPDGRHFVFLAVSAQPGQSSVRVGSLDETRSTFLTNADGSPQYRIAKRGSSGYLLFGYQGALVAQPFSADKLKLTGTREVVVPEVLHVRGRAEFSVSETGILAYRAGSGRNRQLSWIDRNGKRLEDVGPVNNFYSWSLSPDNEKFVACQEISWAGGLESIWTLDLVRGVRTRFATGFEVFLPIWSPDGREILFSEGGDTGMTLQRQALNSGNSIRAVNVSGHKFPSDWSSDGRFVAYSSPLPDARALTLWVAELDRPAGQGHAQPFLSADGENTAQFAPSPQGQSPRWIAYIGLETGQPEIYIRDFPAGRQKWLVSTGGGTQPHWRRDGKELFYLAADGRLMAVEIRGHGSLQVGSPRPLFQTGLRKRKGVPDIFGQDYAPGRDGQRFLVNRLADEAGSTPITLNMAWPR